MTKTKEGVYENENKSQSKKAVFLCADGSMVITAVTPAFAGKVKAVAAGLTLTEQSGWLESAYVEWQPVKNAEGYVAYVKEASASDDAYEKLDDTLIRQYADYWRADALGLKEGSYVMKVTAVLRMERRFLNQLLH